MTRSAALTVYWPAGGGSRPSASSVDPTEREVRDSILCSTSCLDPATTANQCQNQVMRPSWPWVIVTTSSSTSSRFYPGYPAGRDSAAYWSYHLYRWIYAWYDVGLALWSRSRCDRRANTVGHTYITDDMSVWIKSLLILHMYTYTYIAWKIYGGEL